MRSLFTPRGIILVWAVLTASVGLGAPLRLFASEIRRGKPEVLFARFYNGFSAIPSQVIGAFSNAVHFEPATVIFSAGTLQFQTVHLIFLVGVAFLVLLVWLYQRAIKSPAFADDFLMLGFCYLVIRIVVGIWIRADVSIQPIQEGVLGFLMIALIIILTWRGGGRDDSKIFWRGIFEIYIVLIFVYPDWTIPATTALMEGLASFGEMLQISTGFVFWSLLGMGLGAWLLYGAGSKPSKPARDIIEGLKKKVDEEFDKAKK